VDSHYSPRTLTPELFNLLINPETHEFALRWHRDDVNEKASEEEEREALKRWGHGVSLSDAVRCQAKLFCPTDPMEYVGTQCDTSFSVSSHIIARCIPTLVYS
jgi:hypothetical protein